MTNVIRKKALFTTVSKNYLSFGRTLLNSVKKHNDNIDLYLLLADECDNYFDKSQEIFTVVESIALNLENYEHMAFRYSIVEFNTALKPFFINYLLNLGYEKIIYLDPDIMVFNSLDFIYDILDQHSIVLTPHLSKPLSANEQCFPPENMFLLAGTFNLGFIGISNSRDSIEFINWWSRKCFTDCIIDAYQSGCFVDQKWCTLIPGFFDSVYILRHQGCNMAVWNLHERKLSNQIVNGSFPLIFYHFSGYNPYDRDSVTKNQSLFTLANRPDLRDIFDEYSKSIFDNGYADTKDWPYKYDTFDNGVQINSLARQLYDHVSARYPYPFSSGKDSYFSLLISRKLLVADSVRSPSNPSIVPQHSKSLYISFFAKLFKYSAKFLGPDRYSLLMNYLRQASNIRKQDYLVK